MSGDQWREVPTLSPAMGYRNSKCGCFWEFYLWLCRFWGIITAIGLWGVGVETAYHQNILGIYLLLAALLMSVLETVFIVHFWVVVCSRDESSCCVKLWKGMLWFDNWKKGILYIILSIGCFIRPHQVWLALISGGMLVVCSILYFLKTYKAQRDERNEQAEKNRTYDRIPVPGEDKWIDGQTDRDSEILSDGFDEVQDDIDENLSSVSNSVPDFPSESLAEQDEILDV